MVSTGPEKVLFIFKTNCPLKEEDAEELAVNTISNAMMGVYRDNPWLLDMLKKHLNEIDN